KDPKLLKVDVGDEPQPPCEKCGKEMVLKGGRYGPFFSCSGYPDCSNIRKISRGGKVGAPPEPTGVKCPECGEGELVQRFSRRGAFYSCNRYPKCKFAVSHKPIAKKCPECGNPILVEKESKRMGRIEACPNKECGYKAPMPDAPGESKAGA
ncbi:MAG: topoisomerase DNA-binding C4 zinc finger domain-containing protein, partial [Acidobacteria bacterium]|nr:topoisomerase DNA-binding C4 zinc finger domain-containing protein [Acidobacteriota bacterium]